MRHVARFVLGIVALSSILATAIVAHAAPKVATIEVKGMVCSG